MNTVVTGYMSLMRSWKQDISEDCIHPCGKLAERCQVSNETVRFHLPPREAVQREQVRTPGTVRR